MHTSSVTVRRTHALGAALLALLAVIAAGCGDSAVAVPELSSFTNVAHTSSAADSATFSLEADVKLPGLGKKLSFSAEGAFDTPAKRSQMSVDLSSFAELLQGLSSSLGGTVTGDLGSPDDWKLEVIQDGDTAYVHFPLLAKQLPAGKTWVKGDAKTLSSADAGQLKQFGSLAGTDPRDAFGLLEAVSGSIEAVGTDEIRGVETSHYKATIDTAKVENLVPDAQRKTLDGLGGSARAKIPIDVWIDADQRVRKLAIDLAAIDQEPPAATTTGPSGASGAPLGILGGGGTIDIEGSVVLEVYDYGKALQLELPPADQVADAATLKRPR
jgi:hypothetical protein